MDQLQVFEQRDVLGKDFKMYGNIDNPLFLAKDVAEWIDYDLSSVHKLVALVEDDEKVRKSVPTPGGSQEMWFLTEDGLYEVLMQSRKPIAKQFKSRVKEILRSIRKHGAYATPQTLEAMLTSPEAVIKILTALKNEQEKSRSLQGKIEQQKPLVMFAETCMSSKDCIKVGELAKIVSKHGIIIGQNRLWNRLREWGHIIPGTTEPYQRYIDNGYYEVVQMGKELASGARIFKVMRVTPKGQVYIINRLRNEKSKAV